VAAIERKNISETVSLATRMRQQHTRSCRLICRIDVTAFAGVMFALVAMFLLPATIVIDSPRGAAGAAVDLAKTSHSVTMRGANREDALLIAVQRDGRVWFDEDQITSDHLAAAIRERLSHGAEPKVYIRTDMRAKYGTVIEVLDGVRSAGIENIAFLVEERKSLSPP
jgi:biopolymer transport protein TolR